MKNKVSAKIEVIRNYNGIKIMIGGLLHLRLPVTSLPIIQSWVEGMDKWCIEYTIGESTILSEYDNIEKWKEILKQLNKVI